MVEINRDLKADKQINKNLLDEEAEMQPYVYGEWAQLAVEAKDEVDRAKLTLEKVKAERFLYHKMPSEPDAKAPSDKLTENMVNSDSEVMDAQEEYLKANKIWGLCRVAEEAMQQKRSMIKVLTELHSTQYFTKEEVSKDIRETKVKSKEATVAAVAKGVSEMNKKHKKKKKKTEKKVLPPLDKEDLYDGTLDDEEEEVVYQTDYDKEMDFELEEEELEEQPKAIEIKAVSKKPKKKKKDKPKGKCPYGYEFGFSFGLESECDECELEQECYRARPKK